MQLVIEINETADREEPLESNKNIARSFFGGGLGVVSVISTDRLRRCWFASIENICTRSAVIENSCSAVVVSNHCCLQGKHSAADSVPPYPCQCKVRPLRWQERSCLRAACSSIILLKTHTTCTNLTGGYESCLKNPVRVYIYIIANNHIMVSLLLRGNRNAQPSFGRKIY